MAGNSSSISVILTMHVQNPHVENLHCTKQELENSLSFSNECEHLASRREIFSTQHLVENKTEL